MTNIKGILLENYNTTFIKNSVNTNLIYLYNSNFYIIIKDSLRKKLNIKNQNYLYIYLKSRLWVDMQKNNPKKYLFVCEFISKNIIKFLNQFYKYEFYKLKFGGKGYKIRKKNKIFFFLFNRAHPTRIWWRYFFFKRLRKYKMYIKGINIHNSFAYNIIKIRKFNVFTKKGLRLTRQKSFKKKGKK